MRKIIQIASEPSPESSTLFYALCDDGTVWRRLSPAYHIDGVIPARWEKFPSIDTEFPEEDD